MDNPYVFSVAFGIADTRESCIESSQDVYRRLMMRNPDSDILRFDVLALACMTSDNNLNHDKLRSLIRLFRPDRDGNLSLLDFVKSIDAVYKEISLLRASVRNSQKLDRGKNAWWLNSR
jgi:hypothetical protein